MMSLTTRKEFLATQQSTPLMDEQHVQEKSETPLRPGKNLDPASLSWVPVLQSTSFLLGMTTLVLLVGTPILAFVSLLA
jgi:hypothetical protein